eukprot:768565-Hanusia_phi.AAC.4
MIRSLVLFEERAEEEMRLLVQFCHGAEEEKRRFEFTSAGEKQKFVENLVAANKEIAIKTNAGSWEREEEEVNGLEDIQEGGGGEENGQIKLLCGRMKKMEGEVMSLKKSVKGVDKKLELIMETLKNFVSPGASAQNSTSSKRNSYNKDKDNSDITRSSSSSSSKRQALQTFTWVHTDHE